MFTGAQIWVHFYFYLFIFVEGTPEIPKNLRLEYQTYSLMYCHLSCGRPLTVTLTVGTEHLTYLMYKI